jgi:hypothetical protein
MATKSDFTPDQWEQLQWALNDTTVYLSLANPGWLESFKEAGAASKYLGQQRTGSQSTLVRDLASSPKFGTDPTVKRDMADMADEVLARLTGAAQVVADVAPDEIDAFKAFIIGLGEAAAEASGDTSPSETAALDRVKAALG